MKKSIFIVFFLLLSIAVMAQNKKVTGTVSDSNGKPLIGAYVVEVGTNNAYTTDRDGQFTLTVKPDAQISVSYIGFETQILNAAERTLFMVILMPDSEALDEIVITAYGGTQRRSKVTNSIAKVKEETFATGIYSNPAQALSGAVAGLRVQKTSGNPGAMPTVVLRGGTDFGGSG
ncbi:carboxypeptidase-like regulatory domain-containing protein, partial [Escherichia coli]